MNSSKRLIIILILLATGALFLQELVTSYQELEHKKAQDKLHKTHSEALLRARAGFDIYASLVSSLKSYTRNAPTFPSEIELQTYLNDLLTGINFKDSIVVSYNDPDHVFKYVITPKTIDPAGIKGVNANTLVSKKRMAEFEQIMQTDDIHLLTPINVKEGWVGFPFSFTIRDKQNKLSGYLTPIINVKYLLNYFYKDEINKEFVNKFIIQDNYDLTREVIYNDTPIYNENVDPEYYKNFNIPNNKFIYSTINVFGLKLKIGSAYKVKPKASKTVAYFGYLWYFLLSVAIVTIFYQFGKIKGLNNNLTLANAQIQSKNNDLEKSLFKIQTLIKEIHHRVKNNMQMIAGVLTLQQDESTDNEVKSALEQSKSRIHSMALVHEKLYSSISLQDIKIKEYTTQLVEFVDNTIGNKGLNVKQKITINDDLIFDGDTTSNLGLIMNELLTNSFKYAFSYNKNNSFEISLLKDGDHYSLKYSDSGSGLPEGYNFEDSDSLGLQLIVILTEQLNGRLHYSNQGKSVFKITFTPLEVSFSR
ncbi:sensor histidine kinase [Bizionia paragorgiae]|uniref:histidine kinase n=1 Tax=Bizionia paragorgiae TaxID=283786 RepID=A0A1H4C0V9_BIZPA|nr:sensor histidine kinase [Bizionia paragorgiae]SEA53953.1 Two-component sensor histidine kinase, contains HisKA and HATPase domains [Bizionia paragorgiae]